ncbi:SDR family NAD(P)-dependent oxidoreductase [Vibrio sp. TH_r3]|uniref:SDR family NAD(P)-dependent oxidoreductase n=1 Tax=Vibrio sp. TH_r3 TaxID=3082084 RepID=UPI002955DEB4|nr:SDR family NAD(P)-dependent oxidoreductase [Vibrio sp. TH_r3]MDV7104580.1 SDR family NAD(P)-dependent oxidoreductase [Vibrio sp. TH_r3]
MQKIILVTGSTDGIGLETAKALAHQGHHVIIHGRNNQKVQNVKKSLDMIGTGKIDTIVADLSSFDALNSMIREIAERFGKLDILINNAGVYSTQQTQTKENLDIRFMVNTIAPYLLVKSLLALFDESGRIINLSSAAQSSVDLLALQGTKVLSDGEAYAQSKLALTMWSRVLGLKLKDKGPLVVSVNPKSFLGSKMVRDAYNIPGHDIQLGADILVKAALSQEFSEAHGAYFDNDITAFASPHTDALNDKKSNEVLTTIETLITKYTTH